ncbi:RNA polymerase sigma-B factor [Marinactinospora thermotolerans DSM 45154]|uniref:RNA polymerase sigma-B factor n=1 Tax=Marinactinospora thermotolerans DSM 45154 TaxID=1122192 RepID=A0A1T4P5S5_9ACTN|nr:SigB/SigF/SigG family RNA polymerase sigma factor [Marinactinospora thermotolerans]SJZ86782.1 RNA polymerase sigma-B factor [Marinactinospora thermotolerans DSM 45154]
MRTSTTSLLPPPRVEGGEREEEVPLRIADTTDSEELLRQRAAHPHDPILREEINERLVQLHTPMVRRLADHYRDRGEPRDDLRQVAMMGLMKAIRGFDPDYGRPFISYLLPMVTGELKRHFRDSTWAIRVPRRHQEKRSELNRFTREFTQSHGRSPTVPEIAEGLGLDVDAALELIDASAAYSALSLDAPHGGDAGEDDGASLGESIGTDDADLENVVDREALKAALERIEPRERRVLLLRFFGNKTQAEIAGLIGVSQMQVSRLLAKTLRRLREEMLAD